MGKAPLADMGEGRRQVGDVRKLPHLPFRVGHNEDEKTKTPPPMEI